MIETPDDIQRALAALQEQDPRLREVIAVAGEVPLRRTGADLPALVAVIVGQQVSRASAQAIFARLQARLDLTRAAGLIAASDEDLMFAGLSRPKQRALRALGAAFADGRLDLRRIGRMPAEDAVAELSAVHGIGRWTAECHLLFAHGHADVFPAGDLALQAAAMRALALPERPGEKALRRLAAQWAPHRATAARLLWAYYAACAGREAQPGISQSPVPQRSQASQSCRDGAP